MTEKSIYQFNLNRLNGEEISLSAYKGKVLLIVNTASGCGFTPQLKDLEILNEEFSHEDFEILAFPSNDFGTQEPLNGKEIQDFCTVNYGVTFDVFDKIRVRGNFADPLYKFLSDKKQNGKVNASPRWNFHKYLINHEGKVKDFFYPFTNPTSSKIKKSIIKLIQANKNS